MACAADLARAGCEVVIYEALQVPGGVLRYGIPEFRLPNSVINAEINNLKKLRVRIECNTLVGRLFTIEQMIKEMGFHAYSTTLAPVRHGSWVFPANRSAASCPRMNCSPDAI